MTLMCDHPCFMLFLLIAIITHQILILKECKHYIFQTKYKMLDSDTSKETTIWKEIHIFNSTFSYIGQNLEYTHFGLYVIHQQM